MGVSYEVARLVGFEPTTAGAETLIKSLSYVS